MASLYIQKKQLKVLNILLIIFVSQYVLVLVVGGKDFTCEPGYGNEAGKIFTSGYASQCSGISKITTEAECKAAAEYNRKNSIDKNVGYGYIYILSINEIFSRRRITTISTK